MSEPRRRKQAAEKPKTNSKTKNKPTKKGGLISKLIHFSKKEYHLPISNKKADTFLHKKRSFIPSYFKKSWQELKLVTWPNRTETFKLTIAVFIFAILFGAFIGAIDFVIDKLFRGVLLS